MRWLLTDCRGGSKGGREGGPHLPPGSNFFHFHAVFGKIWQNRMLAHPRLGEILDPPLDGSCTAEVEFEFTT